MRDLPGLTIRIQSVRSNAVRELLGDDAEEELFGPNAAFLVARLDGNPVGCIALIDQVRFGELRRLCVREDVQGRGIGAALVTALEKAALDIGLRRISLRPSASSVHARSTLVAAGYRKADAMHEEWLEKTL